MKHQGIAIASAHIMEEICYDYYWHEVTQLNNVQA